MKRAIVLPIVFLIAITSAFAQETAGFSSWLKLCATLEGDLPCLVRRDVSNADGTLAARAEIDEAEDGSFGLRISVQKPVLLPYGLSWAVDGVSREKLYVYRCIPLVCHSAAEVGPDFVDALKRGKAFTIGVTNLQLEAVEYAFDLTGFTKAFGGPPQGTTQPETSDTDLPSPLPDPGPWRTECQEKACMIGRSILVGSKPVAGLELHFGASQITMVNSVPLGIDHREGVGIKPETGYEEIRIPVMYCNEDSCKTQLLLDDKYLSALVNSSNLAMTAQRPDGSKIAIVVPLVGLQAELDKLP